jgi:hypothetical protein
MDNSNQQDSPYPDNTQSNTNQTSGESPVLSDTAVLRKHGMFGKPTNITINLYPSHLQINKADSEETLYDIPLSASLSVRKAMGGGTLYLKTGEENLSVDFNSVLSNILLGGINMFRNNSKSKLWADTINQYKNNPSNNQSDKVEVG